MIENLEDRFDCHTLDLVSTAKSSRLRTNALEFAQLLNELCPDTREKYLAMTHLETALMWANKAIAMGGGTDET
jgi:hypothetical protein